METIGKFFICSLFVIVSFSVVFWIAEKSEQVQVERQLHNTYESEVPVENELWDKMYEWGLFEN